MTIFSLLLYSCIALGGEECRWNYAELATYGHRSDCEADGTRMMGSTLNEGRKVERYLCMQVDR